MNRDGLTPCPFCGNKGEKNLYVYEGLYREFPDGVTRKVYIPNCACGANLDNDFITREDAVKAWNHRTLVSPHLSRYEIIV